MSPAVLDNFQLTILPPWGGLENEGKPKMENNSNKKAYEKPIVAKCGEFRKLTGGIFTTMSDLLVGRRGMI
ncbi:keywimysin-related RiPP [Nocardia brasiliensis]|uniref:keywimysin-related RiPP n=1 Tax=Nocardia brasiliensis TaxID=37326 RepID=UPI00366A5CEC